MADQLARHPDGHPDGELDGELAPDAYGELLSTSRHPQMVGPRAPGLECSGWFTYHRHPSYRARYHYQA